LCGDPRWAVGAPAASAALQSAAAGNGITLDGLE
jgi:hypothetical protein